MCEAELNWEQQDCTLLLENMKAILTLFTSLYKRLSLQISFHKANAFNASTDWSIWNTYNIITIRIISLGMLEKDTEPLIKNLLCKKNYKKITMPTRQFQEQDKMMPNMYDMKM